MSLPKPGQGIALLLDSAPRTWTSQEEIHLRICRRLKSLGIRPVLVYAAELPPDIHKRLREGGAEIEIISYQRGRFHFYRALGRMINYYSISIVHVCFFDYFSLIPWLARLQGMRAIIYEELNSGLMRATSWKAKLLQLRSMLTTWPIVRIIAVSEFVKKDLIKRGISADRILVKYLGIDEERFKPNPQARELWTREYSVQPDELIISTVTVLRPFKDPETIVEACAILAERAVPVRLFVAGDGVMLPGLKAMTTRLHLTEHINWLGYCKDPVNLLQASDIFLLASIGEAGGLALLEAMACGVPIVASRSGVNSEYVEEGRTGLLATPRNAVSFADAIEKVARDEKSRRAMSTNSRTHLLQRFTVDIDVENTIRIYESVWIEKSGEN
jgi:glycosyltransferase involved in cell wall biosynthesis